ncbi:calcium-translocating P-type ATPase, PMCA-type [Clostridium sp. D2Q-11]|uniref:P-type Ca(2+) transporter n=1 Tax=Anaeromonas frigoriresistens TaxID=2683708 RepID=A0A942UT38_9FIRM|nr:calcium-translocating P-type ATPase, PMCA-type [Anaeromonas frigoriresistens]MBS4538724.1 calcium-translocating P-type ATPase, PMCA-type [Anaeromonas frigoriresistens]
MNKSQFDGLTSQQVEKSREDNGDNKIEKGETESFWDKLTDNLKDPIIKILIVALIIEVGFFFWGKVEWYEPLGITIAVVIAIFVSTYSEYSNEQSFQKLQEQASQITCKVFRDGSLEKVSIEDIVKRDKILLQSGDKIPVDGIVLEGDLSVDQSVLNGESEEADKKEAPGDYEFDKEESDFLDEYKVFRGTVVVEGEAVIEAETVGKNTFFGQLAEELESEDRDSPLKVKLGNLADKISKFGYAGGILIALSFMFKKIVLDNIAEGLSLASYFSDMSTVINDVVTAGILAIIIIVVVVPEGLPMMIAFVLSMNMKKLLKDNILVRKLVGIETSGSLNILFSDKTGTITKGELEVISFITGNIDNYENFEEVPDELRKLLDVSIKENTEAVYEENDEGEMDAIGGDFTEQALLHFTGDSSQNYDIDTVDKIPFNSENKYSAAEVQGDYNTTLVKGAPEVLLEGCDQYYDKDGNKKELNKEDRDKIQDKVNEMADNAIRVIAIATSEKSVDNDVTNDLTLVGIVGIRDDVRKESIKSIEQAQKAGIQVVMITGDKKETALAIAKESGIIQSDDDVVLTSKELDEISDQELKEKLPNIKVIARALPTDKSRLIKTSQSLNKVVGMTGDGVNDSPALKKADIGFAMGSGTEVAKEAGDIVILDDNFNSITKTILYGRTIFKSIRKFIVYQLTVNIAAVLIAFVGPFIGIEFPLTMTQMLWVNLVMDTFAALAFGGEPPLDKYMDEMPKTRDESIINKYMWSSIITNAIVIGGLSIFFLISDMIKGLFRQGPNGNEDIYYLTGFFGFFIFINLLNMFNARTKDINIFNNILENDKFLKIVGLIFIVQIVMTYIGGAVLRTEGLIIKEWLVIIPMAMIIIPIDIIRKLIVNKLIE